MRYITDPACPRSWAAEGLVRKLMTELGDELRWTWVMGGLAREYRGGEGERLVVDWLEMAAESGMPFDPLLWREAPIASTYPACMAVKAAGEQGPDAAYRYLRAVREGIMCLRRKLDTTEALVEEARGAGLDVERFRRDLESNATVEAFGADLEEARAVPDALRAQGEVSTAGGHERVTFPAAAFVGADGQRHWVGAREPYERYRVAAEAAGARPAAAPEAPGVLDALRRFGRMATREVELVCDLPGPRAAAELWRLATEWRVRALPALTGHLWELA